MIPPKHVEELHGATTVLLRDQPSFIDDSFRRGKYFDGPRKVADLAFVGVQAPDADPDRSATAQ